MRLRLGDKKQTSTEGLETEVRTAGESQRRTENWRGGDQQGEALRSCALSALSSQATGRTEGSPQEGRLQSLEPEPLPLPTCFPHLQRASSYGSLRCYLFPGVPLTSLPAPSLSNLLNSTGQSSAPVSGSSFQLPALCAGLLDLRVQLQPQWPGSTVPTLPRLTLADTTHPRGHGSSQTPAISPRPSTSLPPQQPLPPCLHLLSCNCGLKVSPPSLPSLSPISFFPRVIMTPWMALHMLAQFPPQQKHDGP